MNLPTPLPFFYPILSPSLWAFMSSLSLSVFCSKFSELIYIINSFSWFYFNSLWRLFLFFSLWMFPLSLFHDSQFCMESLFLYFSPFCFPFPASFAFPASLFKCISPENSLFSLESIWLHISTITFISAFFLGTQKEFLQAVKKCLSWWEATRLTG